VERDIESIGQISETICPLMNGWLWIDLAAGDTTLIKPGPLPV
jgi:hypothetical protein